MSVNGATLILLIGIVLGTILGAASCYFGYVLAGCDEKRRYRASQKALRDRIAAFEWENWKP